MSTRVPINIDPNVREALRAHLSHWGKYSGTGVGYSEFIRRAIIADGGVAPDSVQVDRRTDFDDDHQCDGYAGDPGASAPRCEQYKGHPGRHRIFLEGINAR